MASPRSNTVNFEGARVSVFSPHPFDEVMKRLYTTVGCTPKWPSKVPLGDKEDFTNAVKEAVGPHDFMIFGEFDHGSWVGMFGVGGGLKAKRLIIGNPLIAITMLQHDLNAGLFVPIEILVVENEDRKSTTVIYNLPSAQITAVNKDPQLLRAAQKLDEKAATLFHDVTA